MLDNNINHFSQLEAWKINHELILSIYKTVTKFPEDEKYGLVSQMKRAVTSITANIAEGWGRYHYADKIKFYYQSRGSNCEIQNFLIASKDLNFIDQQDYDFLKKQSFEGYKLIN